MAKRKKGLDTTLWVGLAVFAAFAFLGGSGGSHGGTEVPMRHSWRGPVDDWRRERYALARQWLTSHGVPHASAVAAAVVAHWALETGNGQSEFHYNVGGIHAHGDGGRYFAANDAGVPSEFAAYDSARSGVDAYLSLISRVKRYAPAWALLTKSADSADWIVELGRDGYYGADQNQVASGWRRELAAVRAAVSDGKAAAA